MRLVGGTFDITLPDDLSWTDQFWSATVESVHSTLEGGLIIKRGQRLGRPITLSSPGNGVGLVSYETLTQLQALAELHLDSMTLTAWNADHTVTFRYDASKGPVDGQPVRGFSRRESDERWSVTINLREIE